MKKCLLYLLLLPVAASAQIHHAGTLDSFFGVNGIVSLPDATISDCFLTNTDSIIAVGLDIFDAPVLMKFSSEGNLDKSFGTQGIYHVVLPGFNGGGGFGRIIKQTDGKWLLGGSCVNFTTPGNRNDFAVARLNEDWTFDTTFNHLGYAMVDFYQGLDYITSLVEQPNGGIVACGSIGSGSFGMVRFNSNGTLDSTFCNCGTGFVIPAIAGASGIDGNALVMQPDGKFLVGGDVDLVTNNVYLLMRYNNNGTPDQSFGNNGMVTTNFSNYYDVINAMTLLPDGKILAAGVSYVYGADFAIARYMANGMLDSTFGTNGFSFTNIDSTTSNVATCMGIEPDGKIVLAGRSFSSSLYMVSMARYKENGLLDSTFGNEGITYEQFGDQDQVNALRIQNNGEIVIGGYMRASGSSIYTGLLLRYQAENNTGIVNLPPVNTELEVYPNPTHDAVTIFSATYKQWATITVVDVLGKTLQQYVHDFGSTAKSIVNLTSYAPGIYAVHIYGTDGKSQVIKVVRQ